MRHPKPLNKKDFNEFNRVFKVTEFNNNRHYLSNRANDLKKFFEAQFPENGDQKFEKFKKLVDVFSGGDKNSALKDSDIPSILKIVFEPDIKIQAEKYMAQKDSNFRTSDLPFEYMERPEENVKISEKPILWFQTLNIPYGWVLDPDISEPLALRDKMAAYLTHFNRNSESTNSSQVRRRSHEERDVDNTDASVEFAEISIQGIHQSAIQSQVIQLLMQLKSAYQSTGHSPHLDKINELIFRIAHIQEATPKDISTLIQASLEEKKGGFFSSRVLGGGRINNALTVLDSQLNQPQVQLNSQLILGVFGKSSNQSPPQQSSSR